MKCPYCLKSVSIFSAEWKNQPQQNGTRKCPHCGGIVKNVFSGFSGPVSIVILALCLGLAVFGHSYLPGIPMFIYGILGGAGIIFFGLRLLKAQCEPERH